MYVSSENLKTLSHLNHQHVIDSTVVRMRLLMLPTSVSLNVNFSTDVFDHWISFSNISDRIFSKILSLNIFDKLFLACVHDFS